MFCEEHPDARTALDRWYRVARQGTWAKFADVRQSFNTSDFVAPFVVFDIGGNKYRLVVEVQYQAGIVWVKFVGTHVQYDRIDVETVNDY